MPRVKKLPSWHHILQTVFLCYIGFVGYSFFCYARWAMGQSEHFVAKPPAVEAFLPISAMLAAKRFFLTGEWDVVHPAGLCLFFLALLSALFFRKSFCGYLCPLGAISDLLFRLGQRLGLVRSLPGWAERLLCLPKYLLLAFFLSLPLYLMGLQEIEAFLASRYNLVCDTKMLLFFLEPGPLLIASVLLLVLGSVFLPSFWCRAFCPYGALLGILALFSPLAVTRNPSLCTGCGKCQANCPQHIAVWHKTRVNLPECTGCLECVAHCPVPGCLGVHLRKKSVPSSVIWLGTLLLLLAIYLWARLSGHWQSQIPTEMLRFLHENIHSLSH
ncbi:MAG: 4Fe-4S binding protein [Desulfovibrio sp.]|nr:4Fe-4S binding protein [Desulfovibrio sp.]